MKEVITLENAVFEAENKYRAVVRDFGAVPKKTMRERRKRSKAESDALGMAVVRAVREAEINGLVRKTVNGYSMSWED